MQRPTAELDWLGRLKIRAGARVASLLSRRDVEATSLRQDLAIIDREFEDFVGASLVGGIATFIGVLLIESLMLAVASASPGP